MYPFNQDNDRQIGKISLGLRKMFCSLSGIVPKEPVLSTSSKHVFEKQLLLKYLKENAGKDPISHQVLEDDQIIDIINGNI